MLLENRVAVVTGGGYGIGRAIALGLALEGADVVVAARSHKDLETVADEIARLGRRSLALTADLLKPETADTIADKTMEQFGRIDILVNNSGSEGPIMPVAAMDLAAWNDLLTVNLTGMMLCCRAVLNRSMLPRKQGVILNLASVSGRRGGPTRSAYCSSKFGVVALTQSLACEVGKSGIRVNAIAPGAVEGARIERVFKAAAKNSGISYDDLVTGINNQTALGRMVKPEEVADLAIFLASDHSSAITGQTINIDAGSVFN